MTQQTTPYKTRNDEFNNASPQQRKVMIAKDVLQYLGQGRIRAESGTYFVSPKVLDPTFDTMTQLEDAQGRCDCCAQGAIFYATLMRTNNYKGRSVLLSSKEMMPVMTRAFSTDELLLLEGYFEGWSGDIRRYVETHVDGQRVDDEVLRVLMQNIIDHGGIFVPQDLPSLWRRR